MAAILFKCVKTYMCRHEINMNSYRSTIGKRDDPLTIVASVWHHFLFLLGMAVVLENNTKIEKLKN